MAHVALSTEDMSDLERTPTIEHNPSSVKVRRGIVATIGLLAVGTLCLAAAALSPAAGSASHSAGAIAPLQLFESPEVVNLLTNQRMEIAHRNGLPAHFAARTQTRARVARELRQVSQNMQKNAPAFAKILAKNRITEEEKEGIMHLLQHVGDRRVQSIGTDATRALRESQGMDKVSQRKYIVSKLQPRAAEIRKLHQEIYGGLPGRLSGMGKASRGHGERRLQAVVNGVVQPAALTAAPETDWMETLLGFLAQGESMLSAFKLMFHDQIKDMGDGVIGDLIAASGDLLKFLECDLKAGESYEASSEIPMDKLMQCPLKIGENGMKAIGDLFADFGLDPSVIGIGDNK